MLSDLLLVVFNLLGTLKHYRLYLHFFQVFEYFASFRTPDGELFMTPADLVWAVVPVFPPPDFSIVRDGCLRGEQSPGELHCPQSELFIRFDTNGDGVISFPE